MTTSVYYYVSVVSDWTDIINTKYNTTMALKFCCHTQVQRAIFIETKECK